MVAVWIGLGVLVVSLAAGLGIAVVRGLQAWRQLKRTKAAVAAEVDRIVQATGEIERQLAAAGGSQASLKASLERLSVSRSRLSVQLAAIAEAQWVLRRLLPFLPR